MTPVGFVIILWHIAGIAGAAGGPAGLVAGLASMINNS
jgi:hypothetical protein